MNRHTHNVAVDGGRQRRPSDGGEAADAILDIATSLPGTSPCPQARMRRMSVDPTRLQQLLKEEMRLSGLSRRQARGGGGGGEEGVKQMDCTEPLVCEMNLADCERKERRREQNRRAAQRCRRKKRINQMSVLQNYEWIVTHNSQLEQEVSHLRQEMTRLNSVLKAHRNACTCAHVHKGPLHAQTANVKLEPAEDSPGPEAGYLTPPPLLPPPVAPTPAPLPPQSPVCGGVSRSLALTSCQYESPLSEDTSSDDMNYESQHDRRPPCSQQPLSSNGHGVPFYASAMQARNPTPSYPSPTQPDRTASEARVSSNQGFDAGPAGFQIPSSCCGGVSYPPHQEKDLGRPPYLTPPSAATAAGPFSPPPLSAQLLAAHNHERVHGGLAGSLPVAASLGPALPVRGVHAQLQQQLPEPGAPFVLLEDLAGLSGGAVGSCMFQAQPNTPLGADGRRSISSVSSDVSSGGGSWSGGIWRVRTAWWG